MFCEYKNIAGNPREGIHAARIPIIDLAFWDTALTILVIFIASRLGNYNFVILFIVIFLSGIIAHKLFCVNTKLNSYIFPHDNYKKISHLK